MATIKEKEFYTKAARWTDATNIDTVKKYWYAFVETIIREVFQNGSCIMPGIGEITLKKEEGSVQVVKKDNETEIYPVPDHYYPSIRFFDNFTNDVNMKGYTHEFKKRVRGRTLTQSDYKRALRADSLNVEGNLNDKQIQEAKENFAKIMNQRQKKREE
nr:MAG TPA: Bacterial DNA-binding protein [Caudoviricetes sp.]